MSNPLSPCTKLNVLHLLNVCNVENVENGGRLPNLTVRMLQRTKESEILIEWRGKGCALVGRFFLLGGVGVVGCGR